MRKIGASGLISRNSPTSAMPALTMRALIMRACRFAVLPMGLGVALGVALTTGFARAGDTDDRTISEKIVDGFYGTIRGTNMDNHGIDYRERSPLVVPPKLDLPPPAASAEGARIANWPKDPDERQRKAAIAAKKKNAPPPARVQTTAVATAPADPARPVNIAPPPEDPPIPGATRPAYANDASGRLEPIRSTTSPAICSKAELRRSPHRVSARRSVCPLSATSWAWMVFSAARRAKR